MRLAGDLTDFSLSDLIQIHGAAGRSCCVKVNGPAGTGAIVLAGGEVVDAWYGSLSGVDAMVALLAKDIGFFQVEPGTPTDRRTISMPLPRLLLLCGERAARGDVPRTPRLHSAVPAGAQAAAPPAPVGLAGPGAAAAQRTPRILATAGVAAAAVLAAGLGFWLWSSQARSSAAGPLTASPAAPATIAAGGSPDAPPLLLSGLSPLSPDPTSAISPTVVCRVLVDEQGAVREAKIYRSRLEFAAFEEAALAALPSYRFQPARQDGKPVAVWINLPVTFR